MPLKELETHLIDKIDSIVESKDRDYEFVELSWTIHALEQAEQAHQEAQKRADGCGCHNCRGRAEHAYSVVVDLFTYQQQVIDLMSKLGSGSDEEEDFVAHSAWQHYIDRNISPPKALWTGRRQGDEGDNYGDD